MYSMRLYMTIYNCVQYIINNFLDIVNLVYCVMNAICIWSMQMVKYLQDYELNRSRTCSRKCFALVDSIAPFKNGFCKNSVQDFWESKDFTVEWHANINW